MPGLNRNKYVLLHAPATPTDPVQSLSVDPDDYFVIRKSDILGLATLQSYRSNILTLLDLNAIHPSLPPSSLTHLLALADDVGDMCLRWERSDYRKIPD